MGSKPVREAHMLKYGATMRQLQADFDEKKLSALDLQRANDRLSKPRRQAKKFVYESKHLQSSSSQMEDLFPPFGDVEEVVNVERETPYPEDWRRLPESEKSGKPMIWIYERMQLDIETPLAKSEGQIRAALERSLREHVDPVTDTTSRRDVREMVREGLRIGVLVDIIATRRNILTGVPHQLADFVYGMMEEEYPVAVTFTLVGITDNATKLVAKDVFDARSQGAGGVRRLSFSDLDGEHLRIAFPRENEADKMRRLGEEEARRKEEERRQRTWTPKYVPPPEPEWLQHARVAVAKAQTFLRGGSQEEEASGSRSTERTRIASLPQCSRCWSHKSDSAVARGPSRVAGLQQEPPSVSHEHEEGRNHTEAGGEGKRGTAVPTGGRLTPKDERPMLGSDSTATTVVRSEEPYTLSNCVDRLRALRRQHRLEQSQKKVVKPNVELLKVVDRVALKMQRSSSSL